MDLAVVRERLHSHEFALIDLFLVAVSGAGLCLYSAMGIWALLIALIPWGFRLLAGLAPFRRTRLDPVIAIFVFTAFGGYWASHDTSVALTKLTLILMAVAIYYAVCAQPGENRVWLSILLGVVGVAVSLHYFLSHDFIASPRRLELVNAIGRWIMNLRPALGWTSIHPNYVSGFVAITMPFILYPAWTWGAGSNRKPLRIVFVAVALGLFIFTLVMTTSRGIWMGMAAAISVWAVWKLAGNRIQLRTGNEALFPSVVLIFIAVIVIVLYAGPATVGGNAIGQSGLGSGSRAELFFRSVYLVSDFPFTGGGLGSFSALYSHYLLGIPHFNVPNSHNLFLDVSIEQGLFGGLAFLAVYTFSLWRAARSATTVENVEMKLFGWMTLIALIIAIVHGMVDDYLYYEEGAVFSLVLPGIAASLPVRTAQANRWTKWLLSLAGIVALLICGWNAKQIRSAWFANLGAVRMAQVELIGFPSHVWAGMEMADRLEVAEAALHSSLELDPAGRTANHRLGLIEMLRRNFPAAVDYLRIAHTSAPNHRGIIKSLGYGYAWLGDLESAQALLRIVPESRKELDSYIWYWSEEERPDLSAYARELSFKLDMQSNQP